MVSFQWKFLAVNILNLNEKVIQFKNEYMVSKPSAKIVAYIDGRGINEKIGSSYVIQWKTKAIKKFLGANIFSIVYIWELEDIEDSLSYTLSQDQITEIWIFIDRQAALQVLENLNKCSAP